MRRTSDSFRYDGHHEAPTARRAMRGIFSAMLAIAGLVVLNACTSAVPGGPVNPREQSRDRMLEIIDALNGRDAESLTEMFTDYARAEFSEEIDEGVEYIFSVLPDGTLEPETPNGLPPGESLYGEDGEIASLAWSIYRVSAAGDDYWLMFGEFTVNTLDPENVGIYALGVVPRTESEESLIENELFAWSGDFTQIPRETAPGIFIAK
jgi:hypothetical protein